MSSPTRRARRRAAAGELCQTCAAAVDVGHREKGSPPTYAVIPYLGKTALPDRAARVCAEHLGSAVELKVDTFGSAKAHQLGAVDR